MTKMPRAVGGVISTGAAALAAYVFLIRPWHLRWGATDDEVRRTLPGDDLVPNPRLNATHAVTIHAPVSEVWPWLVQIGQGRGGFYSYDWIENLMGLDIRNADRIIPEFQNLKVGDTVPLAPNGFGVPVAILEPNRALVLHGDTRAGGPGAPNMRPGDYLNVAWGWFLNPIDERTTRLLERWRADWKPSPWNTLFYRIFLEPGAFLMERRNLLGIKQRAERAGQ
jgi:hypothetical protein